MPVSRAVENMRTDLLALAEEDLTALSNRGTLKRALREVDESSFSCEIQETEQGEVSLEWSDSVTCTFPANEPLGEAHCTCPALGTCRHLIRSVLAYQRHHAAASTSTEIGTSADPWDPGAVEDAALAQVISSTAMRRAKQSFKRGEVVELVRSSKPSAHFLNASCTIRFLVPSDIRYVHCDCVEQSPCQHAALAVWAFRELASDQSAGTVAVGNVDEAAPLALIHELQQVVSEVAAVGCGNLPTLWRDRLARLQNQCLADTLIWPADILREIITEYDRYRRSDARFDSQRLVELVGELLTRCDALASDQHEVPRVLIRGMPMDRETPVGAAHLSGLGCGAMVSRHGTRLAAYSQDSHSGATLTVSKWFDHTPADDDQTAEPLPFWRLATRSAVKSISFAQMGVGELIAAGGNRTAGHELKFGRQAVGVNPQAFQWERLRAPLLVDNLAELGEQLRRRPPAGLRPRRLAHDLQVCPIGEVRQVRFDTPSQQLIIDTADAQGTVLSVRHPYTSRGREGFEALQTYLGQPSVQLLFVAGHLRLRRGELVMFPTCLVWQHQQGRIALQPWVDRYEPACRALGKRLDSSASTVPPATHDSENLLTAWTHELVEELGTLLVRGLSHADQAMSARWQQLAGEAQRLGLVRTAARVGNLALAIEQKFHGQPWDKSPAVDGALTLCVHATLLLDR